MYLRAIGRGFTQMIAYFLVMNSKRCTKLAMSSKLSGFKDVWRHNWDSLCIVGFRCTQNGKHSKMEKGLNQIKLWAWNHTMAHCLFQNYFCQLYHIIFFLSFISHPLFGIICCYFFIRLLLIFGAPERDSV